MVLNFFSRYFTWVMLLVIVINIQQRKFPKSGTKRRATLLIAVDILMVYILLIVRSMHPEDLPEWTEWICVAIGIAIGIASRKVMWPFRRKCLKCGKKLSFDRMLGYDENLCDDCYYEKYPEEKKDADDRTKTKQEIAEEIFLTSDKVDDIDWDRWDPTESCTLTYVIDKENDRVLLIEKKTGMGSGYLNAPGGHIELEETKVEAAIRETKEETGLDVSELTEMGTLRFQFKNGIRMVGYVFLTSVFSGELSECDEARPFWQDLKSLDYSRMWEDDPLWLPLALNGIRFEGYFIFDDRKMIDGKVTEEE